MTRLAWHPDAIGWVTDALASAASLGFPPVGRTGGSGPPKDLFREAIPLLKRVGEFDAVAFASVEEDGLGFRVAVSDPPERAPDVAAEIRRQGASGVFAWCLYQRRPVVMPGEELGRWVVLHVVATPSRVLGMFLGSRGDSFQSAVSQGLLSAVLAWLGAALETRILHDELAAYNARLEALVEERTREFRRSEHEARAASRAKGDFLANMSHEIRTPIHGIMGFTRLLLESDLRPEQRDHGEVVLRSAESLLAIVNDLLDYAKVEAGRLELENAPFDLRQALEDVVEMVAPRLAGKPVELVLDYGADVPRMVMGDAGRVRQVVLNLVANAVRFTDSGHVTARVTRLSPGGVRIEVEDTGVGIPADRVEAMFEKFTQGEVTGARAQGGTGLGLSIARTLARLMDGEVTARSELGVGSIFTFRLPFLEAAADGTAPRCLEGVRLGLVGGSRHLASSLAALVEGQGGVLVRSPADAGAEPGAHGARPGLPEVVLVDGGEGAAHLLAVARATGGGAPTRLWALLDPALEGMVPSLLKVGYQGWIPKPVRESRLLNALLPERGGRGGAGTSDVPDFGGAKVLLADDDEISLRLGVHLLRRMGCQVTPVPDGADAVAAAEARAFDLVLLDGAMPHLDGYQAARLLRSRADRPIPPVALTASATQTDRARALEAGMDDHLAKPVTPERLARTLSRWLPGSAPATPAEAEHPGEAPAAD
ncbi:MAG TPA: ATP-binding protein [Longimicrobiales bacterium]|nr:ATP-binding protein [Longimicrobiales bacterium]